MTPIPVTRHVSYGYDDALAYDNGDPTSSVFVDAITDAAEADRS